MMVEYTTCKAACIISIVIKSEMAKHANFFNITKQSCDLYVLYHRVLNFLNSVTASYHSSVLF